MSISLRSVFQGKDRFKPCVPSYEPFPLWLVCCVCLPPWWRSNHGNPSAPMEAMFAAWPSIPKILTAFSLAQAPAIFISQPTRAQHGHALPGPAIQRRWFWTTSSLIPLIPGTCSPQHGMRSYPIAMAIFTAAMTRERPGKS